MKAEQEYEVAFIKDTIREGLAKGKTQRKLSSELQLSLGKINQLCQELKAEARHNIQHWVNEELPQSYENTFLGINQIISNLWTSIDKSTSERERSVNISLLMQAYGMRLDLLSSAEPLKQAVEFVDNQLKVNKESEVTESTS